jgi:hypothetical protein
VHEVDLAEAGELAVERTLGFQLEERAVPPREPLAPLAHQRAGEELNAVAVHRRQRGELGVGHVVVSSGRRRVHREELTEHRVDVYPCQTGLHLADAHCALAR